MPLDLESRELLSDIYTVKPDKEVRISKRLRRNSFLEMLNRLEKEGFIKELSVTENELANTYPKLTDEGIVYDIIFTVKDWQKLDEFGVNEFNNLITEPYGKDKQLQIVKEVIIKKALQLENTKFRLSNNDISKSDNEHVVMFPALKNLEKEKFLKQTGDTDFQIKTGDWACDIELLKDLKGLKAQTAKNAESKKQSVSSPKFRFNQGVLFRDCCNEVLLITGERTQEYTLLSVAMSLPIMERIDATTESVELSWRELYDTARRLNSKIKQTFKIDNFFQIDFENKYLHRAVE